MASYIRTNPSAKRIPDTRGRDQNEEQMSAYQAYRRFGPPCPSDDAYSFQEQLITIWLAAIAMVTIYGLFFLSFVVELIAQACN